MLRPRPLRTLSRMINGMTEKGGAIDIASTAAQKLPEMDSTLLNKVFNATATQFGSTEASNFHTAMLGFADEYSKVMGGGVSSDTGRQQALDILKAAYSKGQINGAIGIMRQDISARKSALISGNRYLMRQFGEQHSNNRPKVVPGLLRERSENLRAVTATGTGLAMARPETSEGHNNGRPDYIRPIDIPADSAATGSTRLGCCSRWCDFRPEHVPADQSQQQQPQLDLSNSQGQGTYQMTTNGKTVAIPYGQVQQLPTGLPVRVGPRPLPLQRGQQC
jgi:hypothetical protein